MRRQADRIMALLLILLMVTLTMGQAATALGGGSPRADQATLNETQQTWLSENPTLAGIATSAPDRLEEILQRLAEIIAYPDATRGGLIPLDEESTGLLLLNPVLMEAWRASPEASADLLELIRLAGGGAPRK